MLITSIAYDSDRNLGRAYNRCMAAADPGGWVCFLDHDAVFTAPTWRDQLRGAIAENPKAGLISAVTNRIGRKAQIAEGAPGGHDLAVHEAFGRALAEKHGSEARDISHEAPISGVVMCISVAAWKRIGGFVDGFLGVDNRAHWDVVRTGGQVLLMPGLYAYHWYRGDGDMSHVRGAPRAKRE